MCRRPSESDTLLGFDLNNPPSPLWVFLWVYVALVVSKCVMAVLA